MISRRLTLAAGAAALAAGSAPLGALTANAATPPVGKQAPGVFRFKVGDFEVTALHDGIAARPLEGLIKNVPIEEVRALAASQFLPTDNFNISFTQLVVNTGSKLVLIDCGFADNGGPTNGLLAGAMQAAGIDPKAIDTVLISHFHGDHIMGARLKAGALTYPNAEIKVPAPEWAFWMDDGQMSRAPDGMKANFQAVRRVFGPNAKDVTQFAWDKEVAPGITAIDANGHTPGHTSFVVSSGNGKLLVTSDITNNPLIFARKPEWQAVFDMDGNQAVATRKKMLDMAAAEKMRVSFYHAPFPATGFVTKDAGGYNFVPSMWM